MPAAAGARRRACTATPTRWRSRSAGATTCGRCWTCARSRTTRYELPIALPLTDAAELDLARVGDDLAVTVDGVRRLVALPVLLRRYMVTDACVDDRGLVLRFEETG